ncbi:MAG: hypothetical protein H7A30_06875 [Thermotogae bacterium]|nr:hypothetical protein [Thermotogota bacterium]
MIRNIIVFMFSFVGETEKYIKNFINGEKIKEITEFFMERNIDVSLVVSNETLYVYDSIKNKNNLKIFLNRDDKNDYQSYYRAVSSFAKDSIFINLDLLDNYQEIYDGVINNNKSSVDINGNLFEIIKNNP